MPRLTIPDTEILEAALLGLNQRLEDINGKIAGLRRQLGGRKTAAAAAAPPKGVTRRVLSAAARRRIAEAQKKRWQAFRKAKAAAA